MTQARLRRTCGAGLVALALSLAGSGGARASSPQAWAAAERQADRECRFWLGHRGYAVLGRLPFDASGATMAPSEDGLQLRYRVRRQPSAPPAAAPAVAPSLIVLCSTRRPLFSPELP